MNTTFPLSIPVITCNEQENLKRCLASISTIAAEIIVVDSGSTDGTQAVAQSFGARWETQSWLGFRDQKNVALGLCSQPWVLALDADEEELLLLANKIPAGIKKRIRERPEAFRRISKLSNRALDRLLQQIGPG